MCLAQGHNAVTPMRLEPAVPYSRVKHSTTKLVLPLLFSKTKDRFFSSPEPIFKYTYIRNLNKTQVSDPLPLGTLIFFVILGMLANSIRSKTSIHFGLYHSLFEWFNPLFLEDKANNWTTNKFVVVRKHKSHQGR